MSYNNAGINGVSVLICCYNSATRLKATLTYLANQKTDLNFPWEVIVIDNASTDNTTDICNSFWINLGRPFTLTILDQSMPGKTYALKTGLDAAAYSIVIICDDDNWLASDYLQTAYYTMLSNTDIGVLGGQSLAYADCQLPDWFDEVRLYYACGTPATKSTNLTGSKFIWGAGMVLRTALMRVIFNEMHPLLLTCRKGNELISGGDDEICVRAWLLGFETHFDSRLFLYHYIPANRLTKAYYNRLVEGFAHQSLIINSYKRLYEVHMMDKAKKLSSLLLNLARLLKCQLFPSRIRKAAAIDYLFFITGITQFSTSDNKKIFSFYKKACKTKQK